MQRINCIPMRPKRLERQLSGLHLDAELERKAPDDAGA
jgi:hypothetical protein